LIAVIAAIAGNQEILLLHNRAQTGLTTWQLYGMTRLFKVMAA